MHSTSQFSTAEIADAAGQPEHRAWNFLLLLSSKYRSESRSRCEAEDFGDDGQDPAMPQAFRYFYDLETADSAILELAEIATKLGESSDAIYSVDDLAKAIESPTFAIKQRLNIDRHNRNAECAWPVTFAPDGTPLFDAFVMELLRHRVSGVAQ